MIPTDIITSTSVKAATPLRVRNPQPDLRIPFRDGSLKTEYGVDASIGSLAAPPDMECLKPRHDCPNLVWINLRVDSLEAIPPAPDLKWFGIRLLRSRN